jgi:carbohydrate binding protein with CBM35 domain
MAARNYYVRSSNVALMQYYPGGDLTKGAVGVANTPAGGWIEFQVYSPTTREYRVAFIYKTISSGATLAMDVDGVPAIGAIALPNASGYWYSLDLGFSNLSVTLSAGYHRIRFKLPTGSVYFDSFGLE